MASSVRIAATRSVPECAASAIRPSDPVSRPVTSLRATRNAAATTLNRAVRCWARTAVGSRSLTRTNVGLARRDRGPRCADRSPRPASASRWRCGDRPPIPWARVDLLREAFPAAPALDAALTHALLEEVAGGERPATLRVYRPGPTVAFGRLDALRPGYGDAVRAAAAHGFTPVLRQPGGHAAAYDGASLVVDQVRPEREIVPALQRRFADAAGLFAAALRGLGVDARVGEVPGGYCPGDYSVNARGRVKLVGVAQRLVRGASLLGVVVVVGGADRIRAVLTDVY